MCGNEEYLGLLFLEDEFRYGVKGVVDIDLIFLVFVMDDVVGFFV